MRIALPVLIAVALAATAVLADCECPRGCKTCSSDCTTCDSCYVCYEVDGATDLCRPRTSRQCRDWFTTLRERNNQRYPYPKATTYNGTRHIFRGQEDQWYQNYFTTTDKGTLGTAGVRISAALVDDTYNLPARPDDLENNAVNWCVPIDQYHCREEMIDNVTITREHGCCPGVWDRHTAYDPSAAGMSVNGDTRTTNFPFHSVVLDVSNVQDADLGYNMSLGEFAPGVPFFHLHFYFIDEAERYSFKPGACEGATGLPLGYVKRRNGQVDCDQYYNRVRPNKDARFHPRGYRRFWAVPYMGEHWFREAHFVGNRRDESFYWTHDHVWGLLNGNLQFQLLTITIPTFERMRSESRSFCREINTPELTKKSMYVASRYCASYHPEGDYFTMELTNFEWINGTPSPKYRKRNGPKTTLCEDCGDAFIRGYTEESNSGVPITQGFEISDDAIAYIDSMTDVPAAQWNVEWNEQSRNTFANKFPGRVFYSSGLGINETILANPMLSGLDLGMLTLNLPSGLNGFGASGVRQLHFSWDMRDPADLAPDGGFFDPNYRWGFNDERVLKLQKRPCDWQLSLGFISINNIMPYRGNLYAPYSYLPVDHTIAEKMGEAAQFFYGPYPALGIYDSDVYNANAFVTLEGLKGKGYENHCRAIFWGNVKEDTYVPKMMCVNYDADAKVHRISMEGLTRQIATPCEFQREPESFFANGYTEEFIAGLQNYYTPDNPNFPF